MLANTIASTQPGSIYLALTNRSDNLVLSYQSSTNSVLKVDRRTAIRDQIEILSKVEGFFESSVIFALLRLGMFEEIGLEERSIGELSKKTGADGQRLGRLLRAAVTMGILDSGDGKRFSLSKPAKNVMVETLSESYLADWIRFLDHLYTVFAKLDQSIWVNKGPVFDLTEELQETPEVANSFSRAMETYARLRGRELADYLNLAGSKSLLDVGCGPGTYSFYLALKNPKLKLVLLDFPSVLEETESLSRWRDIPNPIEYLPLNLIEDDIPGQYDTVLISNTLHMLGHKASQELIKRLFPVVNNSGKLVIQAQFLGTNGLGRRWPAILDLIMLTGSSLGENHTVEQTLEWMSEAGFLEIEHCDLSLLNTNSVVTGRKLGGT